MSDDPGRLRCPLDRGTILRPDGRCEVCGNAYPTFAFEGLIDGAAPFELPDLRVSSAEVEADRARASRHRVRLIEALRGVRGRLLASGFEDFGRGLEQAGREAEPVSVRVRARVAARIWRAVALRRPPASGPAIERYPESDETIGDFMRSWVGYLDGRVSETRRILFNHRNMLRLAEVAAAWGATELLEVGSGTGVNLAILRAGPGGRALGLSATEASIRRTLSTRASDELLGLGLRDLFVSDVRALPLEDASVDLVFTHFVLTHMAGSEPEALAELWRVARLGVVLFETAMHDATPTQRANLSRAGLSRDLPAFVRPLPGVHVEAITNIRSDRFLGAPNVLFVLRKAS